MARSLAALLLCFLALNLACMQAQEAPALKGVKACNHALNSLKTESPKKP